jgi:hypothetical protein
MGESCPERARLMAHWSSCSNHLQKVLSDQLLALQTADLSYASFEEKVREDRKAATAASLAFYAHRDQHHCE